ncbi:hypothetical protein DRE_00937 [Drechslerella stenobrocha 248]|uniref:Secreted protein n=1 Tax=Drechslerella stenobrocha 248 TaxID=1043628 RepID=W7HY62_9PEZI|nr:hypothetical protein DRE_00937 [Drechslerella stenobrocha 248]
MSTAILAIAALVVLASTSDLALESCLPVRATSPEQSDTQPMNTISHEPSSGFVRMQRKISSINIAACFNFGNRSDSRPTRNSTRRKEDTQAPKPGPEKDKPKYIHMPQYAANSHAKTTNQIPFGMRPLAADANIKPLPSPGPIQLDVESMNIEPIKTQRQFLEDEAAKEAVGRRGRVHLVGSTSQ